MWIVHKAYSPQFTAGAERLFNGLSEHRWAVCTCVLLVVAAMEFRDVGGVISPSETCNRTSRDVISGSRGEGRVMVERKLRTRYSEPCFLKQCPSFRPLCARPSLQYPHTPYYPGKDPLVMWVLFRLWTVGIFLEYPPYHGKRSLWRGRVNSIL